MNWRGSNASKLQVASTCWKKRATSGFPRRAPVVINSEGPKNCQSMSFDIRPSSASMSLRPNAAYTSLMVWMFLDSFMEASFEGEGCSTARSILLRVDSRKTEVGRHRRLLGSNHPSYRVLRG